MANFEEGERDLKAAIICSLILFTSPSYADSDIKCDTTFGSTLNRELSDFLKNPVKGKTPLALGKKLCLSAPNGPTPCPVNVGGERAGQISKAARKIGPAIVPIAVCLAQHSSGGIREDMNELLSDLVDRFNAGFFTGYYSLSETERQGAAPFSSYIGVVSDSNENYAKRVKTLKARVEFLTHQTIPLHTEEINTEALPMAKEALREAESYLKEARSTGVGNALYFPPSTFDEEITNRLIRFKITDVDGAAEVAEKLHKSLGLSYIVDLKNTPKQIWTLCGSGGSTTCKSVPVSVVISAGTCNNRMAAINVRKSAKDTWWIMNQRDEVFQINPKNNFFSAGVAVDLRDSLGRPVRHWTVPNYTFKISAISRDLNKVYFIKTVLSSAKSKLGDIFLEISEDGSTRFGPLKKEEQIGNAAHDKYIFLKPSQGEQSVPGPLGEKQGLKISIPLPCH